MSHALVAGRFLPPHDGHLLLIETAAGLARDVTIAVECAPDDPIDGGLRERWLRELCPAARIVPARVGAVPAALAAAGVPPVDMVLAGRDERALAAALGARLVLIDPQHLAVPLASAAARADPFACWHDLPAPVRAHHARTICLHGPESTGKSTLAPLLARHFGTIFVPEYGRTFCEQFGLDLTMADLVAIGRTHAAITRAARRRCNRRLILDTDPLMTAAWASMLFGRRDPWFDAFDETADLYLLLDMDLPWVDDGTRFFGRAEERARFFDRSRDELERRGLRYAIVGGAPEQRLERALEVIVAAGLG